MTYFSCLFAKFGRLLFLNSAIASTFNFSALAAPPLKISGGLAQVEVALRDHPTADLLALHLDTESIGSAETGSLLHALEDRRQAGGVTIAIIGNVADGSALVALACDAVVPISNARLSGADDAWCPSPSRRVQLVASVQRLGRVSEELARRLVETSGALSWEKSAGFQASESSAVLLAKDGEILRFSSTQLEQTGLSTRTYTDLSTAIAAIEGKLVRARTSAPTTPPTDTSTPRGRPSVPQNAPPNTPTPSAPANTPGAVALTVDMAKLSPKLEEFQALLVEIKAKLMAFDRYYKGTDGIWTTERKSLKEVWQSKSEMTRHKDTKLRSLRIQRDIGDVISQIEKTTRSIGKICADKTNPEVIRTASAFETLKQLAEAIERNEVDDYEKYKPLVERLK